MSQQPTWICPHCKSENADRMKFCQLCHKPREYPEGYVPPEEPKKIPQSAIPDERTPKKPKPEPEPVYALPSKNAKKLQTILIVLNVLLVLGNLIALILYLKRK